MFDIVCLQNLYLIPVCLMFDIVCRTYTLDQFDDLFSPFGQVVQKNLLKDKATGLPRGVGFVRWVAY